ncbi:hypothetical protein LTR36_009379 [Oleoguttula mirabilis]|uniref:Pheromone receptor n=1 Tax=Oleoguttula mirabilis TaxID=1507867 RepID=A0AAV9JT65_9PEZI|nr:hypothetical protein LTR36_009379 [Oleoguttula mirabilis]
MAPIASLVARSVDIAASAMSSAAPVYSSSILLATFSLLTVLLIIPPMCWHYRNRNLGATLLVAWTIIMNLQTFVNAVLWPADNLSSWYNGSGLCDVEVKLQVAWGVAAPATLGCVLRALANAMNTDRATLIKSKAQRWRDYSIDLTWCIGFPFLQMFMHYIVQDRRYFLYGISGCVPSISGSWLSILLIYMPPVVWTLIDGYFAILIIVRLYRYRVSFALILASSNTTKSRFMRLYVLCLVWILAFIPTQAFVLYINLSMHRSAYSWSETHNPAEWNEIIMVPSNGAVLFDRWIWLSSGLVVFIFFGLGKEAVSMYRSGLLAIGLGKIVPSLRTDHTSRNSTSGTISSFGSKAKMFLKRKSSVSSWYTSSSTSRSDSFTTPVSPKNMTFLETIKEDQHLMKEKPQKSSVFARGIRGLTSTDPEEATDSAGRQSMISRVTSIFKSNTASSQATAQGHTLVALTGQPLTVRSDVSTGHPSPTLSTHASANSIEVIVRREVRQASETAETLPNKAYGDTS